ncbi:MAG: NPCBM/NEW2 domain-containing protein, partial [Bacilli bacterium]|nr:NPCBM/NEW2 domain-containing protein [Bacilli bacterium]
MKKNKDKIILTSLICSIILFIAIISCYDKMNSNNGDLPSYNMAAAQTNKDYVYLSDIDYDAKQSKTAHGSILKDITSAGSKITVKVDGMNLSFNKGMWAHATSTLVYDISAYNYDYFTAYIGLNATAATSSNGVKFYVYTSVDGKTWDLKTDANPTVFKAGTESEYLKIDITGANYLKLYAHDNGSNGNDHAVYADARLMSKNYDPASEYYQKIQKTSYYDEILKKYDANYNTKNNHKLIVHREIVNKLGYWNIQNVLKDNAKATAVMDWILDNLEVSEQVVEVGTISNTESFITVLGDLYDKYKTELKSDNGDVYQKMMIGLAASRSTDKVSSPLKFAHFTTTFDYMERFAIIKELYDKGLMLYGNGWKTYYIEFFRYLMNDGTRNDELKWMNFIGRARKYATGVYSYVQYVKPNYSKSAKPHLYDIANKDKYETKFHLAEYGVPFADNTTRYWMVMEAGGICWNQARTTKSVLIGMGRPGITVYQPEHESALYYISANSDGTGKGSWGITGNIFGWGKTANAWYGGNRTRTLFGWAGKSFTNSSISGSKYGDSAGYIYLAQANLNNYDAYKKSLYLNLLANSFTNNEDKLKLY